MQRMLFLLFQNTQKNGCLILYYREGSFSCGGSTCYSENFLLAKMLTGSERRDDKAVRLHEVTGYGIFPHTSKRLVLTYPNIFENGDFFSLLE